MKKGTIIYIGGFELPDKNAAAHRVLSNAKIFRELGYDIVFIDIDKSLNFNSNILETKKDVQGFECWSVPYPKSNMEWFKYLTRIDHIEEIIKNGKDIKAIIVYNYPATALYKIKNLCKKRNIKIIADVTEWYNTKGTNILFKIIKGLDSFFRMRVLQKQMDGVIVASKYLSDYYKNSGCKTVIIPTLSPLRYSKHNLKLNIENKIKTIYAGSPFRKGILIKDPTTLKDRIDKTIDLFHYAKENGCDFIFDVYGLTKNEFLTALPSYENMIEELSDNVFFYGIRPNEEVTKEIMSSDFTILIRDDKRETRAGFPTKVSESISCGTPVITTKTSDLEEYITEGKNGFFLDNKDMSISKDKFCRILKMDKKEIHEMKNICIDSDIFYYKKYVEKTIVFIQSVENNRLGTK